MGLMDLLFTIEVFLSLAVMTPHVRAVFEKGMSNINKHNCTIKPQAYQQQRRLENLIERVFRLIELDIIVNWTVSPPNGTYPEHESWVMTTDNTGKRLLLLDDDYKDLSLGTLAHGTDKTELSLIQDPPDCLKDVPANDAYELLIFDLLTLPKNSKSMDRESEISLLHICTGSVTTKGMCCNLTITGDGVTCDELSIDKMREVLSWLMFGIAFILISNSVYLIPSSFYEESEERYSIENLKLNLRMRIDTFRTDTRLFKLPNSGVDEELKKRISELVDKVTTFDDNHKYLSISINPIGISSVSVDDSTLLSEVNGSLGLLKNIYRTLIEVFVRCRINDDHNVKFCCYQKPCSCIKNMYCFHYLGVALTILIFSIFITIFKNSIDDNKSPFVLGYMFCAILYWYIVVVIILYRFLPKKCVNDKVIKSEIKSVLQTTFDEKMKQCINYFLYPIRKYGLNGFPLMIVSAICTLLTIVLFCLPLYLLSFRLVFSIKKLCKSPSRRLYSIHLFRNLLLVLYLQSFVLVLTEIVVFYTRIISYTIIGIFLNYDYIVDEVFLVLIALTYIYNCLNNVYQRIGHFNTKIFTLVNNVDNERYKSMLDKVIEKNENFAFQVTSLDDRYETHTASLFVTDDNKEEPFLSLTGLFLFFKYDRFKRLPYMHIPEAFFERVSSEPGYITPGVKYSLLFRALIEIGFMMITCYITYFIIRGFARANDVSETIHTFATIGTSAAVALLSKLLFRDRTFSITDKNMHLKILIEKHLKKYTNTSDLNIYPPNVSDSNIFSELPVNNKNNKSLFHEVVAVIERDIENENKYKFCGFSLEEDGRIINCDKCHCKCFNKCFEKDEYTEIV